MQKQAYDRSVFAKWARVYDERREARGAARAAVHGRGRGERVVVDEG